MSQPKSQARRDESEWVTHKEKIRNLFLKENKYLRGADGVVDTMQRLYGFRKSYALLSSAPSASTRHALLDKQC